MPKYLYFLTVLCETALSVAGIRSAYEQPPYSVTQQISGGVEIRDYGVRWAVETGMADGPSAAFSRLFRYITGANQSAAMVAMTIPVQQAGPVLQAGPVPQAGPVQQAGGVMRFLLPVATLKAGVPRPMDARVRVVQVPPVTLGVLRFSGVARPAVRQEKAGALRAALVKAGFAVQGEASFLSYDPPFTPGFLRRNEVAFAVVRR